MPVTYEFVPVGQTATTAKSGDLIFCHRKGFASWAIRTGEAIKYGRGDHWSHVAVCINGTEIVEALTRGVSRNPLEVYRDIEYVLVHTDLAPRDANQATAFALSCVGMQYGFITDVAIGLRFLTPGRGLWFGMSGTEICSGLAAQALVRGWYIFEVNPSSMSPAELAIALGIPKSRS